MTKIKLKHFLGLFYLRFHKRSQWRNSSRNALYEFGIAIETPVCTVCDDTLEVGSYLINGKIYLIWWLINFNFPITWPKDLNFAESNKFDVENSKTF
jgi:hypothetical protein